MDTQALLLCQSSRTPIQTEKWHYTMTILIYGANKSFFHFRELRWLTVTLLCKNMLLMTTVGLVLCIAIEFINLLQRVIDL